MNRERRKEAGKVFLDLSKYLATTIAISGIFSKGGIDWFAAVLGSLIAVTFFIVGLKTMPPDEER